MVLCGDVRCRHVTRLITCPIVCHRPPLNQCEQSAKAIAAKASVDLCDNRPSTSSSIAIDQCAKDLKPDQPLRPR